jgi:hypothetical protein
MTIKDAALVSRRWTARSPSLRTGSRVGSRGTDGSQTHRWREPDSNFWSLNQSSSAVLTPDAMAGISVMFVFDARLA